MSDAYREAGVDVEVGREAVKLIKGHVARTMRPEVLSSLGSFGSLFRFPGERFEEPILVSGTDGVGTKLKVAFATGKHDTIGIDCVAMVVNDIAAQGAEPLFFLDYFATGKLDPGVMEEVVKGIAEGCVQAGCALVGGETAEMPDMYAPGEYDLAGFAVGVVDRKKMLDGTAARAGDLILGVPSSGIHSNGFSLVRKLLFADRGWSVEEKLVELEGWAEAVEASGEGSALREERTLGELLLEPTRIYVPVLEALKNSEIEIRGLAHITGGGLEENLPRAVGPGLGIEVERGSWRVPVVFRWLQKLGGLREADMIGTFNCGIGMAVIVAPEEAERVLQVLREADEEVSIVGRVVESGEEFRLVG